MFHLNFYLIWGSGTDDTSVFISAVSSGRYSLLSDYFTVLLCATRQFLLDLLNSEALQLNTSHQIEWESSLASPDMQASPAAFSISVAHTPKAKRSPFQLSSWWSLELKRGLEWHPHLAMTSYPKIQSPLLSVCSFIIKIHVVRTRQIAAVVLLEMWY